MAVAKTPYNKAFICQTGRREFRVFVKRGIWWGLVRTAPSMGGARLFLWRLQNGKVKERLGASPSAEVLSKLRLSAG